MNRAWHFGVLAIGVLVVIAWVWGGVAAILSGLGYLAVLLWAICLETAETELETTRRLGGGA